MRTRILSTEELKQFITDESQASILFGLHEQQKKAWPLLEKGLNSLNQSKEKKIEWFGDTVTVQYNPARMVSVSANIDPNVIRTRSCFLCIENLPPEQTSILVDTEFLALANPLPIFKTHFTFAHIRHKKQDIVGSIEAFLRITSKLDGRFTVFFNGATAGASAPDHFHFQACPKDSLPISLTAKTKQDKISKVGTILSVDIETVSFFGNRYIVLKSPALEDLVSVLERLIYLLDSHHPCGKDMINIIADFDHNGWQIIFIPREKHRPDCFYEEGDRSLLVSPGSVEMGGVIITPRENDFLKITAEDISSIYNEVMLNATAYNTVLDSIFTT